MATARELEAGEASRRAEGAIREGRTSSIGVKEGESSGQKGKEGPARI